MLFFDDEIRNIIAVSSFLQYTSLIGYPGGIASVSMMEFFFFVESNPFNDRISLLILFLLNV